MEQESKTNAFKSQVDVNGDDVPDGQGLIIDASANGYHKIEVVDENNFRLLDLGDSDFLNEEPQNGPLVMVD